MKASEPEWPDDQTDREVTPTLRSLLERMDLVRLDDGSWWDDDD